MAFDGVTLSAVLAECKSKLLSGRITKIQQPEKEEIMLVIKKEKETSRLMMTADATLPLIYLAEDNKPSPMTAPNFCMVLRKHIANGKIIRIYQPHMERIINFEIEHLDVEIKLWSYIFLSNTYFLSVSKSQGPAFNTFS